MIHAEAFESLLQIRRLKKKDLASSCELSPSFIADLLAHRAGASEETVDAISAVLAVPAEVLFPELSGWVSPLPDRSARRTRAEAV